MKDNSLVSFIISIIITLIEPTEFKIGGAGLTVIIFLSLKVTVVTDIHNNNVHIDRSMELGLGNKSSKIFIGHIILIIE